MKRRNFLKALSLTPLAGAMIALDSGIAFARAPGGRTIRPHYQNLLVLIELKGGNDGLNTLVPYTDPIYYSLRPTVGIKREVVLQLDDQVGLHPALDGLMAMWQAKELAIIQGVGYPAPNLSHFRSIEIWDTASNSQEYLDHGWLSRVFAAQPTPRSFAADAAIIGSPDLGPLAGGGTRAIALSNTDQFLRQAKNASLEGNTSNKALSHILKVESDIVQAASGLNNNSAFKTEFPTSPFGNAVKTASQIAANDNSVAALRITLSGFDTHHNQPATQAALFHELSNGLLALRSALIELGKWNQTLILTYAEFGRRPKENQSLGTDHGTATVHFALGGAVKGGLHGAPPALDNLNGDGNLSHTVDFRNLYATVLEKWWNVPSSSILGGKFAPLDLLRV